jgi:acyl-coenzyme A thioesterase PaaI-like protein
MKHTVKRKQQNSKMCIVCGLKNPSSLRTSFYELGNNELVALFTPCDVHQSYPGRLHGGMTMAILDETIGRSIRASKQEEVWGVTVEFATKFRKPIPLDVPLRVVGRITQETSRMFEGTGELLLPNGEIGATGAGKYYKLPIDKIGEFDEVLQEWKIVSSPNDPTELEI